MLVCGQYVGQGHRVKEVNAIESSEDETPPVKPQGKKARLNVQPESKKKEKRIIRSKANR